MIEQTLTEEIGQRDKMIKYLQEEHKKRGEEILYLKNIISQMKRKKIK